MRIFQTVMVVLLLLMGPMSQASGLEPSEVREATPAVKMAPTVAETPYDVIGSLSNVDGFFTENLGQLGEGAGSLYCQGSPLSVALGPGWVSYYHRSDAEGVLVLIDLEDANAVKPVGVDPTSHPTNFFKGDDPDSWVVGAGSYREALFEGIWDGIDLRYRFAEGSLKYDLVVAPHADLDQVRFSYRGQSALSIDAATGDLVIHTPVVDLVDTAPVSFQDGQDIDSRFVLLDRDTVTVQVDGRDPSLPLVIDPGLTFSTFIGGGGYEGTTFVLDDVGDVYMSGFTGSLDFPTTPGVVFPQDLAKADGVVMKLKGDGSDLLFSTYLGSDDHDGAMALVLASDGDVIVTGQTWGSDFPSTSGAFTSGGAGTGDAYVVRFNHNCSAIQWSARIGGTDDEAGMTVDLLSNGDIVLVGYTYSDDFPVVSGCLDDTYNGGSDFFVSRLSSNGTTLMASTYIGGSSDEDPTNRMMVVGDDDHVYVAIQTDSFNFPTTQGALSDTLEGCHDAAVFKMDENLTELRWSTYVGGSGHENPESLAVDGDGNVYIVGRTSSPDLPVTDGAWMSSLDEGDNWDSFLLKLGPDGSTVEFCTYYGGDAEDYGQDLCVGDDGLVYFTLITESTGMPTTEHCWAATLSGEWDIYIGVLDGENQTVRYGTYLGGNKTEGWMGHIGLYDGSATVSSYSESKDYPTTAGAYDTSHDGVMDIVVSRFEVELSDPVLPGPPIAFGARLGDGNVELVWEPPVDLGGFNLLSYGLYRGPSSDNMTLVETLDPMTMAHNDTPPLLGGTYHYALTAISPAGEGPRSNTVSIWYIVHPGTPTDLSASPGDAVVGLGWVPPADTGGAPVLGYSIFRGSSADSLEHLVSPDNVTSYNDTDVVNGETYHYAVSCINARGSGPLTPVVSVTPIGLPTAPLNLRATGGDRMVTLLWERPENDGGQQLLGYRLLRGLGPDDLTVRETLSRTTTGYMDSPLNNGVDYHYAILAYNAMGAGPLSQTVIGRPIGFPEVPREFAVVPGDGNATLSWEPPFSDGGMPLLGYHIYSGSSGGSMGLHTTADASATTFVVTGLENGQSAYFAVQAFSAVGEGRRTEALSTIPMGLPGVPVDLVAIGGPGYIDLQWAPPTDLGGVSLARYTIYRGDSPDDLTVHETVPYSQMGFKDPDLPLGRTYYYAIAAHNAAGEGPMCPPVSATTHRLPSIPVGLSHQRDDAPVSLAWGPPILDGGSPVQSYRVYRGTSPDSMAFLNEVFDQTGYVDGSAVPDITYHYSVSAVTVVGEGPRTAAIMVGPEVLLTPPWPPIALEAEVDGLTVTLIWLPPTYDGGSPVTGYVVLRGPSPDDLSEVAWLGLVLSHEDTGVEEDRTYHYCVMAVNDVGQSDPSVPVMADLGDGQAVLGLSPLAWIVIVTLLVLTIVVGAAYAMEPFKYSLVLLLLPLFSRFTRERILENKNRYSIHGYIIDNPGINFSGICEEFDLPLGVATYHLDVLERENYVQSVRDGRLKRFYSTDTKVPNGKMRKTPDEIREALLVIVSEHPGISQKELIRELGIDRETVGYHIRVLIKDGPIKAKRKGRYTVYKVDNMKRQAG